MTTMCLFAPLFREYGYVSALVILTLEVLQWRRIRPWLVLLMAFLLMYAFTHINFWAIIGLRQAGATQHVNQPSAMQTMLANVSLSNLSFQRAGHIIIQFPLLLWLFVVITAAMDAAQAFVRLISNYCDFINVSKPSSSLCARSSIPLPGSSLMYRRLVATVLACIFLFLVTPIFKTLSLSLIDMLLLNLFVLLLLALTALRVTVPSVWFLAAYPPLILMPFHHDQHLIFALPPVSIMMAFWLVRFVSAYRSWLSSTSFQKMAAVVYRPVVALILIMSVMDHMANPFSSFFAIHSINRGHITAAEWINNNVPLGSIIFVDSFGLRILLIRLVCNGMILLL
jgi:hypothetical protein